MLIYKKYIIKSILYPFITLSFILTSLVWATRILKMLYLLDRGVGASNFFKLTLLIVPSLFFMISPIILVISVIYAYNKLREERVLIILKASGLSNFAIAKPALFLAAFITIISFAISLYFSPISYSKLKYTLSNLHENYVSNVIVEKTFHKISKYVTVYVEKKDSDDNLLGIILFDNKVPKQRSILFAKSGKLVMQGDVPLFQLKNGIRQSFDENDNITKLHFDELQVEIQKKSSFQEKRKRASGEFFVNEMLWPDSNFSKEKQTKLIVDGHQRLLWPLFNYCLVFLALSIFLTEKYDRQTNFRHFFFSFLPLIATTYFHFALQKISYQQPLYLFACYINVFFCIIFSVWKSNKI